MTCWPPGGWPTKTISGNGASVVSVCASHASGVLLNVRKYWNEGWQGESLGPVRTAANGIPKGRFGGDGMAKGSGLAVNPCVAGIRLPAKTVFVRSWQASNWSVLSQNICVTGVGVGGDDCVGNNGSSSSTAGLALTRWTIWRIGGSAELAPAVSIKSGW